METLKLLIVDDEEDFLTTIKKRLSRRGYEVETSACCDEAIDYLEKHRPHVVVLDVMLPDRDGILCLQEIKRRWPETAVILLTGHASMQAGLQGIKHGASDYCLKPIEVVDLIEKIKIAYAEARGA